jgi:hypothetical protein
MATASIPPKSGAKTKLAKGVATRKESKSLEQKLTRLAMRGKLSKGARAAIRNQLKLGLPVTIKRGNQIVREHPDGTREVLTTVRPSKYKLPAGVAIIGGK